MSQRLGEVHVQWRGMVKVAERGWVKTQYVGGLKRSVWTMLALYPIQGLNDTFDVHHRYDTSVGYTLSCRSL